MRVLVADDHAIVREGLRQLLNGQKDMEVVAEAKDGLEALEKAKSLCPDVTLLDIAMPSLSGLEAVRLIKEAVPDARIVVLSMHKKEAYVHQVFAAGALGYVLKASPNSDVLEAIRAAYRGEYFLSSKIFGPLDLWHGALQDSVPRLPYSEQSLQSSVHKDSLMGNKHPILFPAFVKPRRERGAVR